MNTSNHIPTIDIEVFNDLLSILEDGFYELLEDFINDTPTQLECLDSAIKLNDFKQIFNIGHSQGGATGNIGLAKYADLNHRLCVQAKEGDIQECRALTNALNANYEECKRLLTEKLNNR